MCQRPGAIHLDVLSWIFTDSVIRNCFEVSMTTTDPDTKRLTREFVNRMCGVNGSDVSSPAGQWECLLEAIIV